MHSNLRINLWATLKHSKIINWCSLGSLSSHYRNSTSTISLNAILWYTHLNILIATNSTPRIDMKEHWHSNKTNCWNFSLLLVLCALLRDKDTASDYSNQDIHWSACFAGWRVLPYLYLLLHGLLFMTNSSRFALHYLRQWDVSSVKKHEW